MLTIPERTIAKVETKLSHLSAALLDYNTHLHAELLVKTYEHAAQTCGLTIEEFVRSKESQIEDWTRRLPSDAALMLRRFVEGSCVDFYKLPIHYRAMGMMAERIIILTLQMYALSRFPDGVMARSRFDEVRTLFYRAFPPITFP